MIAGAAVSVMKTLGLGPFATQQESEYETASIDQEEDGKAAPRRAPRFIDMEPINVPVFADDKVATSIQITLKLEVVGTENEARIKRNMTRLQDRFLRDLYAYVPRLLRNEERVSVFVIKRRLQLVSDKTLGPGTIAGVLVQSVIDNQRPSAASR
jgi:hypothetical protein